MRCCVRMYPRNVMRMCALYCIYYCVNITTNSNTNVMLLVCCCECVAIVCCSNTTIAIVLLILCCFIWVGGYCCNGSLFGPRRFFQAPVLEGELRGLSAGNYSPAYRSIFCGAPFQESQTFSKSLRAKSRFQKNFSEYFPAIYISYANTTITAPTPSL